MPDYTAPAWFAARAIRQGLSARQGLRAFRAAGGTIRNDYWFALYGATQDAFTMREQELGTALSRRPTADEITPWMTTNATGYAQQVVVFTRDRGTGDIQPHEFTISGDRLVSRQHAVDTAINTFTDNLDTDEYADQVVLGGAYVGTYEMTPQGEA